MIIVCKLLLATGVPTINNKNYIWEMPTGRRDMYFKSYNYRSGCSGKRVKIKTFNILDTIYDKESQIEPNGSEELHDYFRK